MIWRIRGDSLRRKSETLTKAQTHGYYVFQLQQRLLYITNIFLSSVRIPCDFRLYRGERASIEDDIHASEHVSVLSIRSTKRTLPMKVEIKGHELMRKPENCHGMIF